MTRSSRAAGGPSGCGWASPWRSSPPSQGCSIWVAAGHYGRGVAALEDGAYSRAISEFSAANVRRVPLPRRAGAARSRRSARSTRGRRRCRPSRPAWTRSWPGSRARTGGSGPATRSRVLATLQGLPPADLKLARQKDDAAAAAATVLAEDLTAGRPLPPWSARRGCAPVSFAAAYLVLDPSDEAHRRARAASADRREAAGSARRTPRPPPAAASGARPCGWRWR